jgi:hypothetical protein
VVVDGVGDGDGFSAYRRATSDATISRTAISVPLNIAEGSARAAG